MAANTDATISTHWQSIVKAALLGTERQAFHVPTRDDALGGLLARLPAAPAEASLLGAAAAVGLVRRAGRAALVAPSSVAPTFSEAEDLPTVRARAAVHLRQMLGGDQVELLGEWLAAAAAARRRAPDDALPRLLRMARSMEDLRDAIAPVLGARGRWLASVNPEWQALAGTSGTADDAVWQEGTRAVRLALLRRLRVNQLARGRELLASTWANEPAEDRTTFVQVLAAGLSMDDEPFLEAALDDRARDVRRHVAGLLMHLPESRLSQRMAARAAGLLVWAGDRKPRIDVTLPTALDPAEARDGIETDTPKSGVGKRAWWLYQLVAATPPGTWVQRWGKPPGAIIAAAGPNEWQGLLLEAWAAAAIRHRDAAWAEALWDQNLTGTFSLAPWDALTGLARALPAERRDQFIADKLRADATAANDTSAVPQMLKACDWQWGPALTAAFVDLLRRAVDRGDMRSHFRLRTMLPEIARRLPPGALADLSAGWPADGKAWDYWKNSIESFLATLQFRAEMLTAISEG